VQSPDCPLSCSHTDYSHLRGPDPQGVGAEGCQRGLDHGPGAAPRGSAHSHRHHLESAAEQCPLALQSECSPQQLSVCTPAGPWQGLGHCRVCQSSLLGSHCPGKPKGLRRGWLRCSPQHGSARVLSGLWQGWWDPFVARSILEPGQVPQDTADMAPLVSCRYLSSRFCQSSASSLTSC